MKAIISTTYDDLYYFFLPISAYSWHKLGVGTICFVPSISEGVVNDKRELINEIVIRFGMDVHLFGINASENKMPTYMQCARLYAGALDFIPDDEILVTGDIDMIMFRVPEMADDGISVFGTDLVPENQYPMCFVSGKKKYWSEAFQTNGKSVQEKLDDLLGGIDSASMRSDYWGKDQEECYRVLSGFGVTEIGRSNGQNQFATKRLDRDDSFILDRLNLDVYDYHANRPGFEESNFNKILTILQYYNPQDNFDWLIEYKDSYVNLL